MQFIKAVWGDHNSDNYSNVRNDVEKHDVSPQREMESSVNCVVYCFGLENEKWVKDLGHETRLLDECHEPHWFGSGPNWTHKVDAIAAGMKEFHEVIWMDWDMKQLLPLDYYFFNEVRKGASLLSGLTRYKRSYANWRRKHQDRTCLPGGGWLYFRGDDEGNEIIDLVYKFLPETKNRKGDRHYHDEYAMSMAVEKLNGGWHGVDWWAETYQPSVLLHPRGAIPSSKERAGKYFKTH
tara:strand:- start:15864 stop:16574 length:711 start_codon:yes stop_codon:yes gene_type:complete